MRVFDILQCLEATSGLKINQSKTCGLHTAKNINTISLPQIQWEKESLHLGSSIGSHESVASLWDKCIRNITATAKYYATFFLTWAAKSLIVKSKMLPLVTHNANVYAPPSKIKQRINRTIEQYIAGHRDITIPINTPAQPLLQGGYNIPDVPLYCDIFFLRPILDYVKHRLDFTPATPQNAMVEFHIGHQLSKLLDLPLKNYLPHTVQPSMFCAHALALIKKYRLTTEHLHKLSINQLYELLISTSRPHCHRSNMARNTQCNTDQSTPDFQLPCHPRNFTSIHQTPHSIPGPKNNMPLLSHTARKTTAYFLYMQPYQTSLDLH